MGNPSIGIFDKLCKKYKYDYAGKGSVMFFSISLENFALYNVVFSDILILWNDANSWRIFSYLLKIGNRLL